MACGGIDGDDDGVDSYYNGRRWRRWAAAVAVSGNGGGRRDCGYGADSQWRVVAMTTTAIYNEQRRRRWAWRRRWMKRLEMEQSICVVSGGGDDGDDY